MKVLLSACYCKKYVTLTVMLMKSSQHVTLSLLLICLMYSLIALQACYRM